MPEHYTKNTLECTAYCKKCKRDTQHRVDSGRCGPCIDPEHPVQELSKKQQKLIAAEEKKKQNPELFEK